jgi:Icc-related predicted phosphoesterase
LDGTYFVVESTGTLRIAALADIHYSRNSPRTHDPLFADLAAADADVVLLCGDLTVHGQVEEASLLARDLTAMVKVPILAVLGNHDYESGHEQAIQEVLGETGIDVLDGDSREVRGIGFAGVKGFCGGFGRCLLEPWGEKMVKDFVHELINEALKLETALAQLRSTTKIVLLHYAPIRETVEGEPSEVFPFLGSSRLEEPINRFEVSVVFHGHAHHGSPEGRTYGGIPVYNVALPVLRRVAPDRPAFRIYELSTPEQANGSSP